MSFAATHVAPQGGLQAWAAPGSAEPLPVVLDPGVLVQVTEWSGAWAYIVCDNGWRAWVDGRLLLPAPPTAASAPAAATPPAPAEPPSHIAPARVRRRALPFDGIVGATLVVGAIVVPWLRGGGLSPVNATDLPVGTLAGNNRGFDLAFLVLALAPTLCLPHRRVRLAGALALAAVAALFTYQLDRRGMLGPGVLVLLAGAAAAVPLRQGTAGS